MAGTADVSQLDIRDRLASATSSRRSPRNCAVSRPQTPRRPLSRPAAIPRESRAADAMIGLRPHASAKPATVSTAPDSQFPHRPNRRVDRCVWPWRVAATAPGARAARANRGQGLPCPLRTAGSVIADGTRPSHQRNVNVQREVDFPQTTTATRPRWAGKTERSKAPGFAGQDGTTLHVRLHKVADSLALPTAGGPEPPASRQFSAFDLASKGSWLLKRRGLLSVAAASFGN